MKRLDLILNGKGGVGKSFFAVNFVQFLKDKGVAHVAIDSDNENSTLKRFHPDTRFLDLDNRRELEWRDKHRLREDDAVMLLVELFRIHQRHWDEIRRRGIPSFELFRADIAKLAEAARTFQGQSTALLETLRTQATAHGVPRIT